MADIDKKKDRQFLVFFRGSRLVGDHGHYELVDVPKGEDAEVVCQPVYETMVENESEGGWAEADPAEIAKLKRDGRL